MSVNEVEKLELRKYLLREISESGKLESIEERLFLDEEYNQELELQEEELIEDYVNANLTSDERQHFEKYYLISKERRQDVSIARALRKYVQDHGQKNSAEIKVQTDKKNKLSSLIRRLFFLPVPAIAGILVIFVILPLLVWNFYFRASESQKALASLNKAYQTGRPLEPRISGFNYAPFNNTRGSDEKKVDLTERRRAEGILLDQAVENPSAENLHSLGRLYLAEGNFDQAIIQLNKVLELQPRNAEVLNDLGVAYLEKSKIVSQQQGGEGLKLSATALEALEKAIEINPVLLDARFNKAISLQNSNTPRQAQEAWQEYLKLDPDSPWAEEATRNLKLLESNKPQSKTSDEIMQEFLLAYQDKDDENAYRIVSRNREMITNKLIPQQLVFLFLNSPVDERSKYLLALSYSGELEERKSGDAYFLDIAKFYSSQPEAKLIALKQAQDLIKEGYEQIKKDNHEYAIHNFTNARELFETNGNVWEARFCDYWIGYSLNRLNQIEKSNQILLDLADFCQNKRYKWLASTAYGWLANNMISSKDLSKAIEFNQKAIELSKQTSDLFNTQKFLMQLADAYRRTGEYEVAANFAAAGLRFAVSPESSPRQKWRDYYTVAAIFLGMKFYNAAALYRKESLILAEEQNVNTFVFSSYIDLGLIYGSQGKYEKAFETFNRGREIIEDFPDEGLKKKSRAYTDLQEGHVRRQTKNCAEALNSYDRALSFYDSAEYQTDRYDAHKGRLLCYEETKNDSSFETELPIIIELFREYRKKILEEQNRNSFFDKEQSVYDIAIDYEYKKQNYENAFDYSEESRSRSLLDLQNSAVEVSGDILSPVIKFSPNVFYPQKLSRIKTEVPENVQILHYSVLKDKTLIWLVKKGEFKVFKTDIPAEVLQEKAKVFFEAVSQNVELNSSRQNELATELYRILISPAETDLDPGKEICLIPDKILFHLPFSSFISPEDNKFFVAKYKFLVSPSATIFLNNSKKAAELYKVADEKLLSIGNPEFSRKDFAVLQPLPSAEVEAREIARLYDSPILLTDKDASKDRVQANLPKAHVVHFAGHYLVNENQTLLSGLVLAGNMQSKEKKDYLLKNHEIISSKYTNTKLIVLSACDTGVEKFYRGEGMIGAARIFLAAGVPIVVASQWKVDSDSTSELMIRFHRYRKVEKLSTTEALRQAQLDLLESDNQRFRSPYYWGGFITIGGYAEF